MLRVLAFATLAVSAGANGHSGSGSWEDEPTPPSGDMSWSAPEESASWSPDLDDDAGNGHVDTGPDHGDGLGDGDGPGLGDGHGDGHGHGHGPGHGDQTCHELGVQCPAGWTVRDEDDRYMVPDPDNALPDCCFVSCADVSFDGATCPALMAARDPRDNHPCSFYGEVQDASKATCSAEECCQVTCGSAQSQSGLQCPAGKRIAADETCHLEGVSDCHGPHCRFERQCNSTAEPGAEDDAEPEGCCFTPYVIGAIASELAQGVTYDQTFDVAYEEYADANCTIPMGYFESGMPVNGTSATCVANSHGGDTPFGFYGYCPGVTGTGAFEYVISEERCPPGEGAEGGGRTLPVNQCTCGNYREDCTMTENGEVCTQICEHWAILSCAASSAPPPPPPTLEEILSRGVRLPPAPTPVPIVAKVLNDTELAQAASALAQALAAPPPPAAPDAPPPPPARQVKSAIVFPVPVETVAAVVAEGTPERAEFEASFKAGMAATLGGGGAVTADDIVIESISSGSVNVDFYIVVPQEATQVAADMFQTVNATEIEVSVGGEVVTASAMEAPEVFEVPNQNCDGLFAACSSDCTKIYKVIQVQSGYGANCAAQDCADPNDCQADEQAACEPGEGECPAPEVEQEDEDEIELGEKTSGVPPGASAALGLLVASSLLLLS